MPNANQKGLLCSVLRDARLGDCTNGGITSRAAEVLLIGEGVEGPFAPSAARPTLKLVRRWAGTPNEYVHAEPLEAPPLGGVGWMFGGNFIYSCDSRFQALCGYPIPVHDRCETVEQYVRNFD